MEPISPRRHVMAAQNPLFSRISIPEFATLTRNRLGLIIGPSIGPYPTILNKLSRELASHFESDIGRNYVETCDAVLSRPTDESEVRRSIAA
jgi:hypothetical protein